jgi:hypothetical protein
LGSLLEIAPFNVSLSHWQLAFDAIARARRAFISNCQLRKCACDLFGTTKRERERRDSNIASRQISLEPLKRFFVA